MDSDGSIRLADFGVARVIEGGKKHAESQTFVGTPCWMAPEVMSREVYDARVLFTCYDHCRQIFGR